MLINVLAMAQIKDCLSNLTEHNLFNFFLMVGHWLLRLYVYHEVN